MKKNKFISTYMVLMVILMAIPFGDFQVGFGDVSASPDDDINGYQEVHGDWTVTGYEEYSNETIALFGDLMIENGGHLILNNCSLWMMSSYLQPYSILVENNGTMELYDCYLTDTPYDNDSDFLSSWYYYTARQGSTLIIENSTIRQCGFMDMSTMEHLGLAVATNHGHISNTTINTSIIALSFSGNNTGFFIENINISQIGMTAIYLFNAQGPSIQKVSFHNVSEKRVIDAQDSSDFNVENITFTGEHYFGAMTSSGFTVKNIVGNRSRRVINTYDCNNFEIKNILVYGIEDSNTEIDIISSSNYTMDNITVINGNGVIEIRDNSDAKITNITGINVTRILKVETSDNLEISGLTVHNSTNTIEIDQSEQLKIDNITINNTSTTIRMTNTINSTISNVTITGLKSSNFGGIGIDITSGSNNVSISNAHIETDSFDFTTGFSIQSSQVYIDNYYSYNINRSIDCNSGEIYCEDVYIDGAYDGDSAIVLSSAQGAYLSNVTVHHQAWRGIHIEKGVKDKFRMDNIHINDTDTGIHINELDGIIFSGLSIDNSTWNLTTFGGSNVTIMNSTIGSMYIENSEVTCINATNTTGAWLSGTSKLTRKWWVDVFVNDTVGPIAGATVKIYDKTAALEVTSITGTDGFARDIAVTDTLYTPGPAYSKNPHSTAAEGPGWSASNSTPYQVDCNLWVNVTYNGNAPPNPPTGLQAVSDEDSNTVLTWEPSTSQDVINYSIYIAKSLASLNSYISSGIPNVTVTTNSYTHYGGSGNWDKYWYGVKANDSENESVNHALAACGNWVVNKTTPQYIDSKTIIIKGSLLVYGTLELNDTTLKLDSSSGYTPSIILNNSANFKCENVTIMRNNTEPYYFNIRPDAIVTINDSVIDKPGIDKYEGWTSEKGIYSLTNNLTITNSVLNVEHYGLGIYFANSFNGILDNITFTADTGMHSVYLLNIYGASGVKITDCYFGINSIYGIYAQLSSYLNISGSKIELDCYVDAYWGIYMTGCQHSQIFNNSKIKGRPAIYIVDSINISIESSKMSAHNSYGIYGDSSQYTTIRNCKFGEEDYRPDISIYMLRCWYSLIEDMLLDNQKESLRMEEETGSILNNITIDNGDLGIWLIDSNDINIFNIEITFIYNGMQITGCRDIYLYNTVINLTFYCLDIYSPGPIYLINCTIENGIGAEITAEGYDGELGVVNLINSTIGSISDTSLVLNNSAVVSLFNTSFNLTKLEIYDSASRVEILHYTSLQVYDIDNNVPAWSNITIFNAKDRIVYDEQVNNGFAEWIVIHEKTIFKEDEYLDNPHRIYFYDGSHYGNLEVYINASGHLELYVSNELPWLSLVLIYGYYDVPAPGGYLKTYEPTTEFDINLTYAYEDMENDPELGTTIHWYVNGVHNSTFDGMMVIDAQYTSKYQTWNAMVFPSDGYDSTYPTYPFESNVLFIANTAPEVSNVTISPSEPTTDDDLYVDYALYDIDGDGLDSSKTTHKWYYFDDTNNKWEYSNIDGIYLPNSYTSKSQQWRCKVTPSDGDDLGLTNISLEVTVGNTPPSVSSLKITPQSPLSNQTLKANYSYSDVDQDMESGSIIKWFKNSVEQLNLNGSTEVNPNDTKKDDEWHYKITPSDGTGFGIEVRSESIVIGNTPPRTFNITIQPDDPTTADGLTATYEFYDDDSDDESYETIVEWLRWSGVEFTHTGLRVKTLSSIYTTKNEIWTCEVTPHDNFTYGKTLRCSISVEIKNSAPTVSNIYVTPMNPTTQNELVANYDYSDLDNDLENGTEIVWYCNGVEMPELNNKLIVDHNFTLKGQVWHFNVHPKDGIAFGVNIESEGITIRNNAPTATNLTITPRFPLGDDNLVASYIYDDPDGDNASTPEIRWYKNGEHEGIYDNKLQVEAKATGKGDNWYFSIKVSDGLEWSEEIRSYHVRIENSKPIVNSISPEPGSIELIETESLEFVVEAFDPDGDLLLLKWRLDKTTVSDSEYYLFETDYYSNNTYELNLTIQDVGKNSFTLSYIWHIVVKNWNRLPQIDVKEPITKNSRMKEDTSLKFLIVESDPDAETLAITWHFDDVAVQTSGSTYTYHADYAAAGEHVVSVTVSDGYDIAEYRWNLTVEDVEEKQKLEGWLGLSVDMWSIIIEIIVLSGTGLLAFVGYRKFRKKKGALKIYMTEIEDISKLKGKDPDKYEKKLTELEEKVNNEFKDGKIEDLHYLMLQELIVSKRGEQRRATVSRKFRGLPEGIAKDLDEMLKDDKITPEEFKTFVSTISKSKTLTSYEKKELSNMMSKWEYEDKDVVSKDSRTRKKTGSVKAGKIKLKNWDDDQSSDEDADWDEE